MVGSQQFDSFGDLLGDACQSSVTRLWFQKMEFESRVHETINLST